MDSRGTLWKVLVYLLYVAMIFVAGRFFWLLVQYVGKFYVMSLLDSHIRKPAGPPKRGLDPLSMNPEKLFPTEILLKKTGPLYLRLLFHPLTRLRLMLARNQGTLSSEELMERERRIVETDWQILWGAWTPFRWLLWLLPFFAMLQSAWLLYQQVQPAVTGQKEIHDILGPVFASIIPLVQVVLITVLLSLGSGLLKRMEGFYLSGVDTLFYDQFLSRLPFQSSDTVILLEALNRHFQELHFVLRRLESPWRGQMRGGGRVRGRKSPEDSRIGYWIQKTLENTRLFWQTPWETGSTSWGNRSPGTLSLYP